MAKYEIVITKNFLYFSNSELKKRYKANHINILLCFCKLESKAGHGLGFSETT